MVICTWSGQLPPRRYKNPTYSPRVFLGGVPWDTTEATLLQMFQPFGNLSVDWPGKDNKHNKHPPKGNHHFIIHHDPESYVNPHLAICIKCPTYKGAVVNNDFTVSSGCCNVPVSCCLCVLY